MLKFEKGNPEMSADNVEAAIAFPFVVHVDDTPCLPAFV